MVLSAKALKCESLCGSKEVYFLLLLISLGTQEDHIATILMPCLSYDPGIYHVQLTQGPNLLLLGSYLKDVWNNQLHSSVDVKSL